MVYFVSWLLLRFILLRWVFLWELRGEENLPQDRKKGGVVLACNHISFLDPLVLGAGDARWPVRFMAKASLFTDWWFVRWFVNSTYAFPVNRGTADRAAWRHFAELVASGEHVAFFPEGTRSRDGKLQAPNPGAGILLHRCKGATVVPCRLWGTDKILHHQRGWQGWHRLALTYGTPVNLDDEWAQEGSREVYQRIAEKVMASIAAIPAPGNGADK